LQSILLHCLSSINQYKTKGTHLSLPHSTVNGGIAGRRLILSAAAMTGGGGGVAKMAAAVAAHSSTSYNILLKNSESLI